MAPPASGGSAWARRPSLRQADNGRVPQRQHVVDTRLEPAPAVEAAGLEEAAGSSIRLIDQAIHLAEISAGGAELHIWKHQAELRLARITPIFLQHSPAAHDLGGLPPDA